MKTLLTIFVSFLLFVADTAAGGDELQLELGQSIAGQTARYTWVSPGEDIIIELTASNVGEALGTGVVLRYEWPAGLELIGVTSMPAAAVSVAPDNGTLDWHVGELFPAATPGLDSSAKLVLTGRVQHAAAGRTLHGELSVVASDQAASWVANTAPALGVAGAATVDLSITASGRFTQGGMFHNLTYDVTIENVGPETAAEVFLLLEIAPVTADLIENPTLTGSAGTTCDIDLPGCIYFNLGPGESVSFTATGQVLVDDGPVDIAIDFIAATNDADTDTTNNRARARVSLPEAPEEGGGGAMGLLLLALLAVSSAARNVRELRK